MTDVGPSDEARRPITLLELFEKSRPPDPDTAFLRTADGSTITYGDLERRVGRIAAVLTGAGVAAGSRVALLVEKSPEALLVYLVCLRIGAVILPMNPSYTDEEVAYILGDATPDLVICSAERIDVAAGRVTRTLERDGAGTLTAEEENISVSPNPVSVRPSDLASILYTSGTTGRPKGAMLTHDNLASNAAALRAAWGFSANDVLVHALPVFHIHGLFVATNCVLAAGASMIFLDRFQPDPVIDEFAHATVFMGVPTYFTRLLDNPRLDQSTCQSMRLFVSGSAPLLAETHAAFQARTGHVILERYGMTELSIIASNPLVGARRPGSVGMPLPGVEVRIAEPLDGIGEIEVRGPNVFPGYWGRPELNSSEFTSDGYFRTGDLGTVDADGYLDIVGRSKDLVISGGLNVYPSEVEAALDALPGIAESAVIGLPDPDFGEAVIAIVVADGNVSLHEDAIRAALRTSLAGFKLPKRVFVVDALPRNAMGKVEKAVLRREFATS